MDGKRALRHFNINKHREILQGSADRLCQQGPAMEIDGVLLRNTGEEKADTALEGKALPFQVLKVRLDLVEGRGLELGIGIDRQVENGDRHIAVDVLKTGKPRAQLQFARWLQANPQAGRKNRLGAGEGGKARQSGPSCA